MIVRTAEISDFKDVASLVGQMQKNLQPRAQFNWDEALITDELKSANTLVAIQASRLGAFLSYREAPDFLEITVLATSVEFRKQGLQTALLSELIRIACAKNKYILLEVHEENLGAINFYRRLGFYLLSTRKSYYTDGRAALVLKHSFENS